MTPHTIKLPELSDERYKELDRISKGMLPSGSPLSLHGNVSASRDQTVSAVNRIAA